MDDLARVYGIEFAIENNELDDKKNFFEQSGE